MKASKPSEGKRNIESDGFTIEDGKFRWRNTVMPGHFWGKGVDKEARNIPEAPEGVITTPAIGMDALYLILKGPIR